MKVRCIQHSTAASWLSRLTIFLKICQPQPLFYLFLSFRRENFSSQQDSNLDRRSRRQERGPLDHHHGPISRLTLLMAEEQKSLLVGLFLIKHRKRRLRCSDFDDLWEEATDTVSLNGWRLVDQKMRRSTNSKNSVYVTNPAAAR